MIGSIHQRLPKAGIKAWTAVEIDYFSRKFGMPAEEILQQFQEQGLTMLAGGGAEIFSKRVRDILCPQKIDAGCWLEIHRIAHQMGIKSNAAMLYCHVETPEERVEHLLRLRSLQDETGGFLAFIPLAFQPGDSGIVSRRVSPVEDLKTIAASRLLLDNVPHIKAYWIMLGEETAAIALHFGADDLDGTIGEEKIAHAAQAPTPTGHSQERLVDTILAAEMLPVERDSGYNKFRVSGFGFRVIGEPDHPLTQEANSNPDFRNCQLEADNPKLDNPQDRAGLAAGVPNPKLETRNPKLIVGKINYLNAVPFYLYLTGPHFYSLPLSPSQMGEFAGEGLLDAGPFSLMDYFSLEDKFQLMDFCIAARDQVRSVILFSKKPIEELDGDRIGITTETSTSVRLLELLLKKRYGLQPQLERLSDCGLRIADFPIADCGLRIADCSDLGLRTADCGRGEQPKLETRRPASGYPELETSYDAVLLIGDKALKGMADFGLRIADCGIKGRSQLETRRPASGYPELETRYQYDLAALWWEWTGLPFVFAVWSVRASLPENIKSELHQRLEESLEQGCSVLTLNYEMR